MGETKRLNMDEERYQSHLASLKYQPQDNIYIESYQYKDDRGFQTKKVILKKDDPKGLRGRLQAPVPSPDEIDGGSRILLLEVPADAEDDLNTTMVPWSREEFDIIMHTMRLPKEYPELIALFASQFTYFPPTHPDTCWSYVYTTSHRVAPVLRITASYDPKTKITSVLVQQEQSATSPFHRFIDWISSAPSVAHPLALLFAILGEHNHVLLKVASGAIGGTATFESEIGHPNHGPSDQKTDLSIIDFTNLVGRLNRSSRGLACFQLGSEEMIDCLTQVSNLLDTDHVGHPGFDHNSAQLKDFRSRIRYWNSSQKSALLRLNCCQKRIETMLHVVHTFFAQRDNQLRSGIVDFLTGSGKDKAVMKVFALASRRDSSAIKVIAVLTMVFLPGTFVAVFLSMPLFSRASTPRFWIFWAITIPLTLLALVVWAAWMKFMVSRQTLQDEEAQESWKDEILKEEVKKD